MYEGFAFFEKIQMHFKKHNVIIDVCGSHGLLAYLFGFYHKTTNIFVIDKIKPKTFDVIGKVLQFPKNIIHYIEDDLYNALPKLLQKYNDVSKYKIGVISCHACSHLSDSILDFCIQYELIEFALMPCCHSRKNYSGQLGFISDKLNESFYLKLNKTTNNSNNNNTNNNDNHKRKRKKSQKFHGNKLINEGIVSDLITFGKATQVGYNCKFKMISDKITPQNRIIIGLKPKKGTILFDHNIIQKRKQKMNFQYKKNSINT